MTEVINTWQRFAEVTIKTNDLDPMYSVIYQLNKAKSRQWMGVFIMTFLLYYNSGEAVHIADNIDGDTSNYWDVMKWMASTDSKAMKRGTERRHMRGENERKALEKLASFGLEPHEMLRDMYGFNESFGVPTYTNFYLRMTQKYAGTQFGPYFIWKLYDIFNICLGMPISLSLREAIKYMPDEPRKSALHFFPTFEKDSFAFHKALTEVTDYIAQFDHPVVPGRKCSMAEAETVLCMMKGYFKTKTHVIGDDIQDKWDQLLEYPQLRVFLPSGVDRDAYVRGELK